MSSTFPELLDELVQYDELMILELLDVSSEELVKLLEDKIEERQGYLRIKLGLGG